MPCCYKIDRERRLVMSTGYGVVRREDLMEHQNQLLADPDFDPAFSQLMDFGHMTKLEVTATDMHLLAERNIFAPGARRAVVVSDDAGYGLARMFETLRDEKGERGIRVFRRLEDGLEWVFSEEDRSNNKKAQTPHP
ncbi:MAG: hypothetical protein WAM91_13470 [Candidatus Acidiferrales bacterium]